MLYITNWAKLTHITNTAARIIGLTIPKLTELKYIAIACIVTSITQDITHLQNYHLTLMPSGHLEVQKGSLWEKPDSLRP